MARAPGHVKIPFQDRNPVDPAHAQVYESPELRGVAWGLMFIAVQNMAGQHDNTVTLGRADMYWVTGRMHKRDQLLLIGKVTTILGWALTEHSAQTWTLKIPNLERIQGWEASNSLSSLSPHTQPQRTEVMNEGECPTCLGVETFRGARYCRLHRGERRRELDQGRQKSAELETASKRNREDTEAAASASGLSIPEMQALSRRNGRSDSSPASAPRRNS